MSNDPHPIKVTSYNIIDSFCYMDRPLARSLYSAYKSLNGDERAVYSASDVFERIQKHVGRNIPLYVVSLFFEALIREEKGTPPAVTKYSEMIFER